MPDMDEVSDRVSTARDAGMHPMDGPWDVTEGEHFTVVAYTDWCDLFVPSIVRWDLGDHEKVDDFTNPDRTRVNKKLALERND